MKTKISICLEQIAISLEIRCNGGRVRGTIDFKQEFTTMNIIIRATEYRRLSIIRNLVPKTGFEPAHPCERCDLNTVRLPISPLGLLISKVQI